MAYGLRLRIEYNDINEVLTRINIYQDGYAGNADVRTAHAAIRVEWGDQGANGMPLVYGSSCTIFFDSEADYEYLYLFSADARKHLVSVEKAGSLFWCGFIEPDSWTEPLIATPYPVQCTAYDMLGFLPDVDFVDDNGDAYEGKKTMFEILQICLRKTGMDLTINSAIDLEEELQDAGTDFLKVHQKNCNAFIGLSCYEVIEQLLHECRIMQRSGQWWIISNSNWCRETFQYFTTTAAGATSTGTLNPLASDFWQEGEASFEMLPALKELVIVQDYGYNANLANNGSFADYNEELARFDGWINNGVTPEQRALNDDGDKYVYIPGKQYPDDFGDQGYGLINQSITKRFAVSATDSVFSLALKYAEMGSAYSSLMFISIRLVGAADNWYIRRKPYFVGPDPEFEWHLAPAVIWRGDDYICLKSHSLETRSNLAVVDGNTVVVTGMYYNTFDNVTAYPADKIADHFESFKAQVPGIPESGTLELYLYVPYTDRPQIAGSCFTGIKIELLDENAEKYPATKSFRVINSPRNNYVPDDVTILHGDYPDIINSDIIYSAGISRLDDSHTTGWRLTGDLVYYTLAELIARMAASAQRVPRQNYQIRLADMIPRMNMVIEDVNNPGKRLVENGITYTDDYQAIDGRYTEILDVDFTDQTLETAVVFDEKNRTKTTNTTAAPVNVEERVTLMDLKSAKVSAPGYLSSEYFEGITDEESGYTRIKPIYYRSGIITDIADRAVEVVFNTPFSDVPAGRKNLLVYRSVEPEAGLIIDQNVLFNSLNVAADKFTLIIDPSEDLAGVIIEYLFIKPN